MLIVQRRVVGATRALWPKAIRKGRIMKIQRYHDYRVITSGNEFTVRAARFDVGFRSIYFYARNGDVLHWFKRKEVGAVIFNPPKIQDKQGIE